MSVNLIKLCVGVDDVAQLIQHHAQRRARQRQAGVAEELTHVTRSFPRRAAEVVDGGSLYWVIRRVIRVRQPILELRETTNAQGKPACAIVLGHEHVLTEPRSFRAFQGWRYFPVSDAPPDLGGAARGSDGLPAEMADELRDLGLL